MRAVTYIRVSTEEEKQVHAFEKQREEARLAVAQQGWSFIREYEDEGKSGTNTKQRNGYKQLFEDLSSDLFDVVVIKSQDRLMRNVKDWYIFISRMLDNGKKLYMYMENRFFQSDDSLITGIKAILAEEYSRELSRKILNSNAHRKITASSIITNGTTIGYDQCNGELVVNEEEAEIVRRVFDLYTHGNGTRKIKNILDNEGVKSKRGKPIGLTTLKRMIKNPLYVGTVVMNKTHVDFDTKRQKSLPEDEWIRHENRVEPIIDLATFELANKIKQRNTIETAGVKLGVKRGTYPMSGKIVCGECGSTYRRTHYGNKRIFWICGRYQEHGRKHPRWSKYKDQGVRENGCDCKWISEPFLNNMLEEISDQCVEVFDSSCEKIVSVLRSVLSTDDSDEQIEKLKRLLDKELLKQNKLLDKMLDGTVSCDLYASKNDEIQCKIHRLQDKISELEEASCNQQSVEYRIKTICDKITEGQYEIRKKYIENHISKITVFQDRADVVVDLFDGLRTLYFQDVSTDGLHRTHIEINGYNIVIAII